MSYSGTITFNIIDVILLLALVLLSMHAMKSSLIKELFSAVNIVGGIFVASCFHKSLAKFFYTHVTNGVSINVLNSFSLIIVFGLFYALGTFITNYLDKLIGEFKNSNKYEIFFTILLRFIKLYVIFAVVIYVFHTKTRILQKEKIRYSHGVIYKHLAKTGRDILNITTQSRQYYY